MTLFPFGNPRRGKDPDPAVDDSPLAARGLTVAYHRKPVLWHVDYTAPRRGLVAVVGPIGAG